MNRINFNEHSKKFEIMDYKGQNIGELFKDLKTNKIQKVERTFTRNKLNIKVRDNGIKLKEKVKNKFEINCEEIWSSFFEIFFDQLKNQKDEHKTLLCYN